MSQTSHIQGNGDYRRHSCCILRIKRCPQIEHLPGNQACLSGYREGCWAVRESSVVRETQGNDNSGNPIQ
jgi:hypothetical protein